MADKRISQLVERTDIANNDVVPIVASGATTTNKATISSIQEFMQENLDLGVTSVGITLGSTGTDVSVTGSPITTSGNITINFPTASATNRGLLSSADWTTFNNKQAAGNYVTLDTAQTITAQKTFTTSGSSDTMIISHGSGSGFALDVIKAGNGEAIRVQKTSGSGNAVTITGGLLSAEAATLSGTLTISDTGTSSSIVITSNSTGSGAINLTKNTSGTGIRVTNNGVGEGIFTNNTSTGSGITIGNASTGKGLIIANAAAATGDPFIYTLGGAAFMKAKIDYLGNITGNTFVKTGGTSSQFLMADGSVNTSVSPSGAYLPLTGGTLTGTLEIGTSAPSIFMRGANSGVKSIQFANAGGSLHWTLQTSFGASGEQQPFSIRNAVLGQDAILIQPASNNISLTGALNGTSASFTGALNGTSASFSSDLTINASATNGLILQNSSGGESPNVTFITPVNRYNIDANAIGDLRFFTENTGGEGGVVRATLSSTGAATFSSSVTLSASNGSLDVGGECFIRGNGSIYKTHEFTTGAANVAIYDQKNASGSSINRLNAGGNSYITGGNVGIGTASPVSRLHIASTVENIVTNEVLSGGQFAVYRLKNSTYTVDTGLDNTGLYFEGSTGATRFFGGGSERMRITSDGYARLSASSGGIQFNGDTAAANALDDYEEGTFTPTLPNGGTLTVIYGRYTKIGRQVTVSLYVVLVNPTNNSSEFRIGGLPFNSGGAGEYYAGSFGFVGDGNLNRYMPITGNNLNFIYFHQNNGTSSFITNANYITDNTGSLKQIIITLTYFTA
jgi:hypothetical protein